MSKQIRMACALMDLLVSQKPLSVSKALDSIEYDENSVRQALRVLSELGYAEMVGYAPNGITKLYVPGPKLRDVA